MLTLVGIAAAVAVAWALSREAQQFLSVLATSALIAAAINATAALAIVQLGPQQRSAWGRPLIIAAVALATMSLIVRLI